MRAKKTISMSTDERPVGQDCVRIRLAQTASSSDCSVLSTETVNTKRNVRLDCEMIPNQQQQQQIECTTKSMSPEEHTAAKSSSIQKQCWPYRMAAINIMSMRAIVLIIGGCILLTHDSATKLVAATNHERHQVSVGDGGVGNNAGAHNGHQPRASNTQLDQLSIDSRQQQQQQQQETTEQISRPHYRKREQIRRAKSVEPSRYDNEEEEEKKQLDTGSGSMMAMATEANKANGATATTSSDQQQQHHNNQQSDKARKRTRLQAGGGTNVAKHESGETNQSVQVLNDIVSSTTKTSPRHQDSSWLTNRGGSGQPKANSSPSSRKPNDSSDGDRPPPIDDFATGFDSSLVQAGFNQHQQQEQRRDSHHDQANDHPSQHHSSFFSELPKHDRSSLLSDYQLISQLPSVLDDDQHQHHNQPPASQTAAASGGEIAAKHANIRVVFNNNPQFIIGSNAAGSRDPLGGTSANYGPSGSPLSPALQRKVRQPSPSLYDDQYNQDESAPSETKVSALPCADQQKILDSPTRIDDQVNLLDDSVKTNTQQQQQHDEPVQVSGKGKSKPPPQIEQQQQQQQDGQTADTPFDQMVKSGLRPPLRMVISMKNKHGDVMKVPINLQGSDVSQQQQQQQVQRLEPATKQTATATFDLGPQMQIHFEKPTVTKTVQQQQSSQTSFDENTPSGGDIFDPSIAKPFAGKTPRGKTSPEIVQQQQDKTDGPTGKTKNAVAELPVGTGKTNVKDDCQQHGIGDVPSVQPGKTQTPDQVQQQNYNYKEDDQQQAAILPPIGLSPGNNGHVQMMVPQFTQFQNKTFANMISEFQRALGEQMTKHLNSQANKSARDQQSKQQQQQEDEHDDLVVAMMAANMGNQPGAANWQGGQVFHGPNQQQVSMTVIRPPKGTSIKEAVRNHAKEGQTMAIISSRLPSADSQASLTGGSQVATPNDSSLGNAKPVGFNGNVRPPPVGVAQRPPVMLQPPASGTDQPEPAGVDPDGFSSSASSSASLDGHPSMGLDSFEENLDDLRAPFGWQHVRLKRDTSPRHHHLEAEDKLASKLSELEKKKSSTTTSNNATTKATSPSAAKSVVKKKEKPRKQSGSTKTKRKQANGASSSVNKTLQKKFGQLRPTRPAENDQADHFLASASQQNYVSSSDGSEDDDESDDEDLSGDGAGSSASADSNDEPSAQASGEGGETSSGNAADDGDDGSDMADDFEDSTAFDNDDEPYNQAAASDRDYSGASSSFEIPSIEINPNTLQQKGCRTVLREVQEIPLNGLGAVQANGQPGSGFQSSSDTSQVNGLRVKRHSPSGGNNGNLINSRKVTSIVMTKECYFPNEQSSGGQQQATKRQPPSATTRTSEQIVSPSSFYGNQGGASQISPSVIVHQPTPQIIQSQSSSAGSFPAYKLVKEQPEKVMIQQQRKTLQSAQQQQPQPVQVVNFYQQPKPASVSSTVAKLSGQQSAPQTILTNFYGSNLVDASRQQAGSPPSASTGQLVKYQLAPSVQQHVDQIGASSSSTIKRRSVGPLEPSASNLQKFPGPSGSAKEDAFMSSAASGIVAKKLYKPPSEDDPYHTLSYSSQTGADPDMDQDEDDSVVMGGDRSGDGQPAGDESQRDSARRHPTGTLSERERAALMDPNHDDTDPVRGGGKGRGRMRSAASSSGEMFDKPDPSDEADESDGDMMDETRMKPERLRQRQGQIQERAGGPADYRRSTTSQQGQQRMNNNNNYRPPLQPLSRQQSIQPVGRRRYDESPDDEAGGNLEQQQADSAQDDDGQSRYGKSFKFEHELSRPSEHQKPAGPSQRGGLQSFNTAEQLRQLSPGIKGYVDTNGNREPVTGDRLVAQQLGALAATPPMSRRQDMDDDDDDDDDDEPTGRGSGGRRNAAASSRERSRAPAPDDPDENPDSDPELNPRETHLPAHSKPKKFEKSFAYVHRDLPKKGAKNPDDFVVSYGRGNLQTEHEDYDSDRDPNNHSPPSDSSDEQARAASDLRQQTAHQRFGDNQQDNGPRQQRQQIRTPQATMDRRPLLEAHGEQHAGGKLASGYGLRYSPGPPPQTAADTWLKPGRMRQ